MYHKPDTHIMRRWLRLLLSGGLLVWLAVQGWAGTVGGDISLAPVIPKSHATDCRLVTDAYDGELCVELDVSALYRCSSPDSSTQDIAGENLCDNSPTTEWVLMSPATAGGYSLIDDEDLPLTARGTLNFEGAGVVCADDTDQTTCTITASGAGNEKAPVAAATTENLNVGVGGPGTSSVDGVGLAVTTPRTRVLVWQQDDDTQNGIYDFHGSGTAMTRSPDADEASEFTTNFLVYIQAGGTAHGGKSFRLQNTEAVTLGSSNITFDEASLGPKGEMLTAKDSAGGYAGLGDDGRLAHTQIPSYSALAALSEASQITPTKLMHGIEGSGGDVTLTDAAPIVAGFEDQLLILLGLSGNSVTLTNGANLRLCGNTGTLTIEQNGAVGWFVYRGAQWVQINCMTLQQAKQTGRDMDGAVDEASAMRVGDIAGGEYLVLYDNQIRGKCDGVDCDWLDSTNTRIISAGSKPTCDASIGSVFASGLHRAAVWVTAGNGSDDIIEWCKGDGAGGYAWTGFGTGEGTGSPVATHVPLRLMSVDPASTNAYPRTLTGTDFPYNGVNFVNAQTGCATYQGRVPANTAATEAWNLTFSGLVTSGTGGTMVLTVSGQDYADNATYATDTLTALVTNASYTSVRGANVLTTQLVTATSFDATEELTAGSLLVVKFCRNGGHANDTLESDFLLTDLSLRVTVN